jgi:hypothetical protein
MINEQGQEIEQEDFENTWQGKRVRNGSGDIFIVSKRLSEFALLGIRLNDPSRKEHLLEYTPRGYRYSPCGDNQVDVVDCI